VTIKWSAVQYFAAFVLLIFSGLAAIAYNALSNDQNLRAQLLQGGTGASGKITDLGGSRGTTSFVDMEFRTRDGRDIKTTYRSGLRFPEIDVIEKGMYVTIVYDPAAPLRAIPAPFGSVIQRDVISELFEFLRKIGLALLLGSPVIVGSALYLQWRSRSSTKTDNNLTPPPTA
jgi:Protein of unknown function (DUF3592)